MFTREHEMLRKAIRAFVEKEVTPHLAEWEEAGRISKAFWLRLGELGFLGLEFPAEYGGGVGDFLSSVVLGRPSRYDRVSPGCGGNDHVADLEQVVQAARAELAT